MTETAMTTETTKTVKSATVASFLKNLTSLNKEVRQFCLGDNSIWSLPSVSSLSDYSIWRTCRQF